MQHIPNSYPPRVRIISDNPLYKPYEGSGDEVNINGRIRWFAREMCIRACAEEVNIVGRVVGAAERLRAIR